MIAILFWVYFCFQIVFIFKNERVTAIPTNPYFLAKMAEHGVILTSLNPHPAGRGLMGHVRDKLLHRRRHHRFSPSRTQRQGGRSAFVNSGRTDGRIWTGPSPFDAPKRRNDDGIRHVAPRVTWHVPRAAALTLTKTSAGAKFWKGRSQRPQIFRVSAP